MIENFSVKTFRSVAGKTTEKEERILAGKEERIFYQAAQEKAEAIIFVRDSMGNEPSDEMETRFGVKYKICESLEEVKGAKSVFNIFEFIEIPYYLHRMAEQTEDFDEFKSKFKHEHPYAVRDA